METFHITLLDDYEENLEWFITAANPSVALAEALVASQGSPGIYSVWDPQDPQGMPLLEETILD
jgi:hypothetical protein